jgi:protein SHQ1
MQTLSISPEQRYGFLNSYSGFFRHITHTDNNVNELGPEPEACPVEERRKRRLEREDEKWDEEYYM